jgi:hypothetical protein
MADTVNWLEALNNAQAAGEKGDLVTQAGIVNSTNQNAAASGISTWDNGMYGSSGGDSGGTITAAPGLPSNQPKSSIFPTNVPSAAVASPFINPAMPGAAGTQPVAQGFDLLMGVLDRLLQAEQVRQQGINQQVDIARLFTELQRASPTQAADLAVRMGLPQFQPDLSFANQFAGPKTTGTFGGRTGTQDIKLPFALNGKELSFLGNNPNVAGMLKDIGGAFGRPDFLQNSIASAIPTSSSLTSLF